MQFIKPPVAVPLISTHGSTLLARLSRRMLIVRLAQGGRLCVAAAASEGAPRGILLGASASGSMQFIEPPAAVPLNNELAAARAEALAAEEAVLWRLTGRVADIEVDLQRALDAVGPHSVSGHGSV